MVATRSPLAYEAFLRRHPAIKSEDVRKCFALTSFLVSEDNVKLCVVQCDIGKYFEKEKLQNVDASRIFNSDETSLLLNPQGGSSVLAKKG